MERLRLWPRVQQYHHPTHEVTFGVITFGAITSSTHKALLTAPARASHSTLTSHVCHTLHVLVHKQDSTRVCCDSRERARKAQSWLEACSATWRSGGVFQRHPMPLGLSRLLGQRLEALQPLGRLFGRPISPSRVAGAYIGLVFDLVREAEGSLTLEP